MNKNIEVIKRNKEFVTINYDKIYGVIDWACDGLNVNSDDLKSKIELYIYDRIKTSEIQELLITHSLAMINKDNFIEMKDWKIVAGRLKLLNMYKESKVNLGYKNFGYGSYIDFLVKAVKNNLMLPNIINNYTLPELIEAEKYIKYENDKNYSFNTLTYLNDRYLIKHNNLLFELPQFLYMNMALMSGSVCAFNTKEERMDYVKELYDYFSDLKIVPQTPVMKNMRRNGNTGSCFQLVVNDSLDSIMYVGKQASEILKNGGATSIYLSKIRSKGSDIQGIKGASGGIVGWSVIYNYISVYVDQLGSRTGAITVALDIWHPDVFDFLKLITEDGSDLRTKAFNIFPQICIPDLFMKRAANKEKWTLFDPHEIREKYGIELADLYGKEFEEKYEYLEKHIDELQYAKVIDFSVEYEGLGALHILKEIQKVWPTNGLPYIFYTDNVNKANPNKHIGKIHCANLCVEDYSVTTPTVLKSSTFDKNTGTIIYEMESGLSHACNLVAINLSKICIDDDIELQNVIRLAMYFQETVLQLCKSPTLECKNHNDLIRVIGITTLGFADWIARKKIKYTDSEYEASRLYEVILYTSLETSSEMACVYGEYPLFKGSDWSKGIICGKTLDELNSISVNKDLNWESLINIIKKQGLRFGGLLSIAPNTSTSILAESTPCMLPILKRFYNDINKKSFISFPQSITNENYWIYQERNIINPKKIIDVAAAMQQWIDKGISLELQIQLNNTDYHSDTDKFDAYHLKDWFFYAWKKGIKTLYYIRQNDDKEGCSSCAN